MKTFCVSVALALAALSGLSAQNAPAPQTSGPDLSGRWNRDATSASPRAVDDLGWAPRVQIGQSGVVVTMQPSPGRTSKFRLDGKETAEALSVVGCRNTVRITKAETSRDKVTITTWLVIKPGCAHGEDEDDPLVPHIGVVDVDDVRGRRKLESITDVYREGETLTVQTTRGSLAETTTTRTTYRK